MADSSRPVVNPHTICGISYWPPPTDAERIATGVATAFDAPVAAPVRDPGGHDRVVDTLGDGVSGRITRGLLSSQVAGPALVDHWRSLGQRPPFRDAAAVITVGRPTLWYRPPTGQDWLLYLPSVPERGDGGRWATLRDRAIRGGLTAPDRLLVPTPAARDRLTDRWRVPAGAVQVVEPPVDIGAYGPAAGETEAEAHRGYAILQGPLTERRNVVEVVDAFEHTPALPALIVLGDGDQRGAIQQRARRSQQIQLAEASSDRDRARVLADAAVVIEPDPDHVPASGVRALACGAPLVVRREAPLDDDVAATVAEYGGADAQARAQDLIRAVARVSRDDGQLEERVAAATDRGVDRFIETLRDELNAEEATPTADVIGATAPVEVEP